MSGTYAPSKDQNSSFVDDKGAIALSSSSVQVEDVKETAEEKDDDTPVAFTYRLLRAFGTLCLIALGCSVSLSVSSASEPYYVLVPSNCDPTFVNAAAHWYDYGEYCLVQGKGLCPRRAEYTSTTKNKRHSYTTYTWTECISFSDSNYWKALDDANALIGKKTELASGAQQWVTANRLWLAGVVFLWLGPFTWLFFSKVAEIFNCSAPWADSFSMISLFVFSGVSLALYLASFGLVRNTDLIDPDSYYALYAGCSNVSQHTAAGWAYSAFVVATLFMVIIALPILYVLYACCNCALHHTDHTPSQEKSLQDFHLALHSHVQNAPGIGMITKTSNNRYNVSYVPSSSLPSDTFVKVTDKNGNPEFTIGVNKRDTVKVLVEKIAAEYNAKMGESISPNNVTIKINDFAQGPSDMNTTLIDVDISDTSKVSYELNSA